MPAGTVTGVGVVAKGAFVPPGQTPTAPVPAIYARVPEFCRADLTLKPSSDSDIKVEVWLPASGWNGKFQAVGNGGFAGVLPYAAMARARAGRLRHGGHRHGPRRQHRRVRRRATRKRWWTSAIAPSTR